VNAISDEIYRYELDTSGNAEPRIVQIPHEDPAFLRRKAHRIENDYNKHRGTITGKATVLCHVCTLKGTAILHSLNALIVLMFALKQP
jgi:hypothetical protein